MEPMEPMEHMVYTPNNPHPTVTPDILAAVLCDGVIDLDAMLQLGDPHLMKRILALYPVSHLETVKGLCDACRWGELYAWAVAHGEKALADYARHPSIPEANYHEGGFPRGLREVCRTYYRPGMINEAYIIEARRACTDDPYYDSFDLWSVPLQFPVFAMCKRMVTARIEATASEGCRDRTPLLGRD